MSERIEVVVAVRPILRIDNPEEKAILKTKSVRVKQFDKSLRALVDDMIETMRATDGVGLAAPQLGILRRVVVIETPAEYEELEDGTMKEIKPPALFVMINPEIVERSEARTVYLEGCLSLPGWYGEVPRAAEVTIRYQDLQGKEHKIKRALADGYGIGRIAQHEVDHLDGVLFTERIEDLTTLHDRREKRPKRRFSLRRKEPAAPSPVAQAPETSS
jgi:peptide deformylase